jgi:hypothetical protein
MVFLGMCFVGAIPVPVIFVFHAQLMQLRGRTMLKSIRNVANMCLKYGVLKAVFTVVGAPRPSKYGSSYQ